MSDNDKVIAYESETGDLIEGRQYYFHPEQESYMFPALVVDIVPAYDAEGVDALVRAKHGWANDLICLCADCRIRAFPIYWCKVFYKKQTENQS